jgi:mono/diheme cytochrome c family protein
MVKVLKWIGLILAGLLVVILVAFAGLYASTQVRLNKTYETPVEKVSVPTDSASLERGQRLVTLHCAVCHGENLAGSVIFHDPNLGTIVAPNISAGGGRAGGVLSEVEIGRAIRHGVGSDGKALLVMPSDAFYHLNDEELGQMVAFIKKSPSVVNQLPSTGVTPLGAALIGAGAFGKIIAAEEIAHGGPRPPVVEPGVTVAYGDYLVRTGECRTCHGASLAGGKDPDPNAPPAPNLTPGGELAGWSEQSFLAAMRTGVTPAGRRLSPYMPWKYVGQMTDDELKAVWLYLQSLPASGTAK